MTAQCITVSTSSQNGKTHGELRNQLSCIVVYICNCRQKCYNCELHGLPLYLVRPYAYMYAETTVTFSPYDIYILSDKEYLWASLSLFERSLQASIPGCIVLNYFTGTPLSPEDYFPWSPVKVEQQTCTYTTHNTVESVIQ